jgi:uncharacterized protein YbjT (DUF2867 family)
MNAYERLHLMSSKRIFVSGATGQQGGAVARHLLRQPGFAVRALTRDPSKPAAKALAQAGAELVQGDLADPASYRSALEGAYGVFSVQTFEVGFEGEVRQGKALADAAKSAGVQHFVYSSVVSADAHTGIPHFESKAEVERHIRQIGIPFTILRPAFFMQNWHQYMRHPILHGTLPLPLSPQTPLQQVSVENIGGVATAAFKAPSRWLGRTFELAGEEVNMMGVADLLTRVVGHRVTYVQVPWDQFSQNAGDEMTRMYRWFEDVGYHVDIAALRRELPSVTPLEHVLRGQDWSPAESATRKAA